MQETPDDRPNLTTSSCICEASSRVGAKTNTVGPNIGLLWHLLKCIKAGIRYPSVFPDPVLAIATMSRFCSATGHVWAWIGVGFEKPAAWIWNEKKMSKHHKCMHICRDDWYFPWQVKKQMFATRKCSNSTLSEYGCLLKQHKAWRGGSLLIHKGRDKKQEASARFINLKEHQSSPYLSAENSHKYFTRVSRRSKLVTKLGYSASPKTKIYINEQFHMLCSVP